MMRKKRGSLLQWAPLCLALGFASTAATPSHAGERGPTGAPCVGDVDHDGIVGLGDIALITIHWGETVPPGTMGDANGNGFISLSDIARVIAEWGRACDTCELFEGGFCSGACTIPGYTCDVTKYIRRVDGSFEPAACACLPPDACRPIFSGGAGVICTGTCPPGLECAIQTTANIDGTICYECVCVVPGTSFCGPGTTPDTCVGVCPPGQCCVITKIRKDLMGNITVQDCACVPWNGNPCRVIAPGGVPQCVGDCPPGQVCNLIQMPVMIPDGMGGMVPNGEIDFMCMCGPAPAAPMCPANADAGLAPMQPNNWNGNGAPNFQDRNNCYNYGTNRKQPAAPAPIKAQPGLACGRQYATIDCQDVKNSAICDGLIFIGDAPAGMFPACPNGACLVALVVGPGDDYHWYRQNGDGTWSHKPGTTPVTNLDTAGNVITDPRTADRRFDPMDAAGTGYTDFCGFMCVPAAVTVREGSAADADEPVELGVPSNEARLSVLYYSGRYDPEWTAAPSDVAEINCRLNAAIAAAPGGIPNPMWPGKLGFAGLRVTSGVATGLPELITVYQGVIEVNNGGITVYYPDVSQLGEVLRCGAIAQGFGSLVPSGPCGPLPRCP